MNSDRILIYDVYCRSGKKHGMLNLTLAIAMGIKSDEMDVLDYIKDVWESYSVNDKCPTLIEYWIKADGKDLEKCSYAG